MPKSLGDEMFLIVSELDILRGHGYLGGNSFRDGPQARREISDECRAASHIGGHSCPSIDVQK